MIAGREHNDGARSSWLLAASLGCCLGVLSGPGRAAEPKPAAKLIPVDEITNVAYYEGKTADRVKHKLDLYLPHGKKDFPVLFFVHGGAWKMGDKGNFGIYRGIGRCFARHGIGAVMINYRLTPKVTHPRHIQDVARAFAWTHKNIQKYGGRPDAIFISGHSAGGHLVALLATDDTYLKTEGLTLKAIKGVMPISGVFRIPNLGMFTSVFGKDPEVYKQASPINHARPDAPPFLILCADSDFPGCDKNCATAFCKALEKKKAEACVMEIEQRNHITILLNLSSYRDPATQAMAQFIAKHLAKTGKRNEE